MGAWEDRDKFAAQQERRSDPRHPVDEDSVVLFVGHGAPLEARLVDLSQEGCRLRTKERVTVRNRLPAQVFFKISGVSFHFRGVLQWTDGRNLLGIRFAQRAAENGKVLREGKRQPAVDAPVPAHHSVAGYALLVHPKIVAAVLD